MNRISSGEISYKYKIVSCLLSLIGNDMLPPVFMCIGSDCAAGDMLGPAVGDLLTHKYNIGAFVYGTLKRPLTRENLLSTNNFIRRNHTSAKIFAIDSALGKKEDNGIITVYKGGLKPASAVNGSLPCVGDYSLTANVNVFCLENVVALKSARLSFVYGLAENIAFAVNDALSLYKACRLCRAI